MLILVAIIVVVVDFVCEIVGGSIWFFLFDINKGSVNQKCCTLPRTVSQ